MASLDMTPEATEVSECWMTLMKSAARRNGGTASDLDTDMITAYVVALFEGKPHRTITELGQVADLRAILDDSLARECERLWA